MDRYTAAKTATNHKAPLPIAIPIPNKNVPRYSGLRVCAYGPEVASSWFFFKWPEAHARIASPTTATNAPAASDAGDGLAEIKSSGARTNPAGTLIRWAIRLK